MAAIQTPSISNQAGTGPVDLEYQSAAKAWVQMSSDVANGSLNVSGTVDNGAGDYDVNFTNNLNNNSEMVVTAAGGGNDRTTSTFSFSVSGYSIRIWDNSAASFVDEFHSTVVHGDLA